MADRYVQLLGFKELKAAVNRNPQLVALETNKLLTRAMSKYKKGIISSPWTLGGRGGGAPVLSGNLRDTHVTNVSRDMATIGPNPTGPSKKYAYYVHEGTRRMTARPWLDYVKQQNEGRIQSLYREFLKNVTQDLAR